MKKKMSDRWIALYVENEVGVLAKVSPQLNMFAVGIQLKILVGLSVLFLSMAMLPESAGFVFDQMKKVMVSFVEAMS